MNNENQIEDSNYIVSQKPSNAQSTKGQNNQASAGAASKLNKTQDLQSMQNDFYFQENPQYSGSKNNSPQKSNTASYNNLRLMSGSKQAQQSRLQNQYQDIAQYMPNNIRQLAAKTQKNITQPVLRCSSQATNTIKTDKWTKKPSVTKFEHLRSSKKQISQDFGRTSQPTSVVDGSDFGNQRFSMNTQQKAKRIYSSHTRTQKKQSEFLHRRNSRQNFKNQEFNYKQDHLNDDSLDRIPGVIMAYSPESNSKKFEDMNERKTLRPFTTQSKGRMQGQQGLFRSQNRVKTASYTNKNLNSSAKINLMSQLEQSQSQIIDQRQSPSQFLRQKKLSMSHVIRQNLQDERLREQELLIQEQIYAQKLTNIRRIMKTNNPLREQDPTINELQSEIIRYQNQQIVDQTQIHPQNYQSVQDPRNSQYQRLEKLKKLQHQQQNMLMSDVDMNENLHSSKDLINYNIVNVQQGVDTITPNVNEFSSEFGEFMDKRASLTQKQTLEQFKNLNNLQNSRDKMAQRNLKQKNNLTKKTNKGRRKKSSEGRSSKVPSPSQQMEQFIQMGSSPVNMQRFDIMSGSPHFQKNDHIIFPVKKKSRSPKMNREFKNRVRTAQQKGTESNQKKRDQDFLAINKTQDSVTVRRIQSQNQIFSKSKRNKNTHSRPALSGQSRQSRSNSIKRSTKSKSAKSRKRSSQKSSNKSRSRSRSKKSKKKSSQEVMSHQYEMKSIEQNADYKQDENLIKITPAYERDSQGSVNSKKGGQSKQGAAKNDPGIPKQESLYQNSQVSYLANNQSKSDSCDSINIQLKSKNLSKKRAKVSSAVVRRKQDPSFINKQSSIGVSFPTNEKLVNSIGSMQDHIQEIENNIKIEEQNLKNQQKQSRKELQDIILQKAQQDKNNNQTSKIKDPNTKQTLESLENHIEKQFKTKQVTKNKSRMSSLSKQTHSSPPSKRRDSQKSSGKPKRQPSKKSMGSSGAFQSKGALSKERTVSDQQSRKVFSEKKEQQTIGAAELEGVGAELEEGTIKIFDEKADTIEKGQEQISDDGDIAQMQKMYSMPVINLAENQSQQQNQSQGLTSKLKKAQRPVPKVKFPELRTVWKDFDEGMLLEYINKAKEYKERYFEEPQEFGNSKDAENLMCQEMLSRELEQEEMMTEAKEERLDKISGLYKDLKDEIRNQIKYRVDKVFESITLMKKEEYNDNTNQEFSEAYKSKNLLNFVFTENFKEQTKQWKLAYDPYSADKMLAIYGKTPPMSFKIRQRVFDDQRNILDRYSLPAPVHNRKSVYDEIQRQYNMSRRDYVAEKQYQRYLQETKDQQFIWNDYNTNQDLYLEHLQLPNDKHLPEHDLKKAHTDFVGENSRQQVQPLIIDRLNSLKQRMIELEILQNSTLDQTCDQSDFQDRLDFNQQFETAHYFDKERIDNDQIYKTKFCYKLLSMINERWDPSMELEGNYTSFVMTRVMDKFHQEIFESKYFDFESNLRRTYRPFSQRMYQESKRAIGVNQMFSYTSQSKSPNVVVLKGQELTLRKEFYYPEHYDYKTLIRFIYSPKLISIQSKVLLGCQERVMRSINWFVKFHASRPQYKNQQYMQKHENQEDIIQGAQKMFFMLKNNFDQVDHDIVVDLQADPSRPHPYSVEFFFNRLVFRACHVPGEDEQSPQVEILEGQLVGIYKDKPLLHQALNVAIFQRFQQQYKEISEIYQSRKKIVDRKLSKYQLRVLQAKQDYRKVEMNKVKRQNSLDTVLMQKESYEISQNSTVVNDLWRAKASQIIPFTEEAIYPQKALPPKGKMAKANFRQVQFETPFEPPTRPYIEKWPFDHLKGLIDQLEDFFKQNQEKTPELVDKFQNHQVEESLFKQWLENIYCEKFEDQPPLSMSERIKTIHFQDPKFLNQVIEEQTDNQTTQQQTIFDSSESDSDGFEGIDPQQDTTTDAEASKPPNLNAYFQSRLRKELRQSILQKDLLTFKNFVNSLDGSLTDIVNHKDRKHQGNTLLHLAVLEVDKSPASKVELINIVTMLVSTKMGAKKDIQNEMGMTAVDYAERVRNQKDRQMILSLLEKI